jgi:hypothetical protein
VVWKIDRIGRDMIALATLARDMDARGVRLVILTLGLDTATPSGRMVLVIMATLAQFEREQMIERTNAGVAAAKNGWGAHGASTRPNGTSANRSSAHGKRGQIVWRYSCTLQRFPHVRMASNPGKESHHSRTLKWALH